MEYTFKNLLLFVLSLVALLAVEGLPQVVSTTIAPILDVNVLGNRIETKYNALDFGAKPDGKTECAMNIQRAWIAACKSKGAARVIIPSGIYLVNQISFSGPCASTSPIVVQIDGILKAGVDLTEFYSDDWLSFESVNGLIVNGKGTLDGQGSHVWKYNDCRDEDTSCAMSPASIKLVRVKNALVESINSINSKGFHIYIMYSSNISLQRLHLTAPKTSPRTNGVHIINSNNVNISSSVIATGDDCISLGQGSMNVAIEKVTCGPGHGIGVGSPGIFPEEGSVHGLIVKNCTLINTSNGLRIRSWPQSPPSTASGMVFQDINMINVKNPIIIDQESNCTKVCNKPPSQVRISNVHFMNIQGSSISPVAVRLICSKRFPCQNVELSNINLKYSGRPNVALPFSSVCTNVKVVYKGFQSPLPCK